MADWTVCSRHQLMTDNMQYRRISCHSGVERALLHPSMALVSKEMTSLKQRHGIAISGWLATQCAPVTILNVVDLPAPFTPSSPKHCPRGMPSQSPSTARTGGCLKPWLKRFCSPSTTTCCELMLGTSAGRQQPDNGSEQHAL